MSWASDHGSVEVRVGAPRPSSSFTKSNLRLDFNLLQEMFHMTSLSEQMLVSHPSLPIHCQPAFQVHLLWISSLSTKLKVICRDEALYLFCIPWESWEDRKQTWRVFLKRTQKREMNHRFRDRPEAESKMNHRFRDRPEAERFICVAIAFSVLHR